MAGSPAKYGPLDSVRAVTENSGRRNSWIWNWCIVDDSPAPGERQREVHVGGAEVGAVGEVDREVEAAERVERCRAGRQLDTLRVEHLVADLGDVLDQLQARASSDQGNRRTQPVRRTVSPGR